MVDPRSIRRFRMRFWPSVGTLLGLAILLTLGTWQAKRYRVKSMEEALHEQFQDQAPVVVGELADFSAEAVDYRRVELQGRIDDRYHFLIKHRIHEGRPGFWLVSPLLLADGEGAVLVNRGWLPFPDGPALAEKLETPAEDTFIGLVHVLERVIPDSTNREHLAQSALDPRGTTLWETYDLEAIAESLPYTMPARPAIVTLGSEHSGRPYPVASYEHITEPYLTAEKHLGYSITWYSLAVALLAMYICHGFGLLTAHRLS